ncbi:MAG TPA: tyrosine recombinase XerC [Macromonas sp.]|nr:tyrosine recombinase XerC [Macromonas sp.]
MPPTAPDQRRAARRSEPAAAEAAPPLSSSDQASLERYLQHVRVEKRLAPRTVELYAEHLQGLAQRVARDGLNLPQVRDAHVRRWVAQLHAAGRHPRGIALVLSCWRGFYTWLGHQGGLSQNPVQGVRAPKAARPLPKALGVEDALRLAEHRNAQADPVQEARDRCVVELLYGSGLRLSELLGLDLAANGAARGWIDADAGEAQVLGKGSKWRTVPVGAPALAALTAWLAVRERWAKAEEPAVFVGPRGARLTPQALRQHLRQRAQQAGLNAAVHPHMLRHSFASHVLQSSSDLRGVQELLGHANIGTTQIYTRLDFQHLAKAYEAAHPRAKRTAGDKGGS